MSVIDAIDLTNVSSIKLGNNEIKKLSLGSNTLWISPESREFSLYPIVMDSAANLKLMWNSVTLDYMQLTTTGNSSFIIKPDNNINLNDVKIIYPYDELTLKRSSASPKVVINKIDNFCLYCHRLYGYDKWSGGIGYTYDELTTIKYYNCTKTIKFAGFTDENNKTYMSGLYVSKVIKSPSCGSWGVAKIKFFPYTFNDEFFCMKSFDLNLVNYRDIANDRKNLYLWDNENKIFINKKNSEDIINLDSTMFSSLNVTYEGLEGIIEYEIKPNLQNEFRDVVLCTSDAMVHFIQEPHNDHRIYIGEFSKRILVPQYLDSFNDENEYMFHICGSTILNKTTEIKHENLSELMYPESLENEYNITMIGQCNYVNSYEWDNMIYKHYKFYKDSKITFNKK